MIFCKKKKTECEEVPTENSPEVIAAREYLEKTHPTLIPRESKWNTPFNYIGCSQNGEYVRYKFYEGFDQKNVYIVLSDKERDKIIELFNEKAVEYDDEFTYEDSLQGMLVGEKVKHRFLSSRYNIFAFMSDDGDIQFPNIIHEESVD